MPLDTELIELLTPDIYPAPFDLIPPTERSGSDLRRWMWTQFLLNGEFADRVLFAASTLEHVWYAGIGLAPWSGTEINFEEHPEMEDAARESGYIWGGIIFRSENAEPEIYEENTLSFSQQRFPIVVRYAKHEPQVLEVHDNNGLLGTSASWAKTTKDNEDLPDREGCITAEHILGSLTRNFEIVDGGVRYPANASLFAPPCMDTAFLETGWPTYPLQSCAPQQISGISSADPTRFDGAITGPVSGVVTHVSAHSKYTGSGVPMLVCHDGLGARGDSGALVDVKGLPTAMHLGKIDLDAGGQESRAISLHQICHVMKLELHKQEKKDGEEQKRRQNNGLSCRSIR